MAEEFFLLVVPIMTEMDGITYRDGGKPFQVQGFQDLQD